MYKSLIIHHNNIPDLTIFDHQEPFNNNGNLDSYIHNVIVPSIRKYDFDIVYIKDNLSSNYLEFYGLTMAYHIRLSQELSEKQRYTPIVILTDLDANTLNKLSSISRIIFTPNIFIAPNNLKSIGFAQYIKEDSSFSDENKREFLENIQVKPPRDNHHDITNEWAIDQWSYLLGINPDSIQKNRKKISSMLYYKYIRSKYHLENKSKNANIKPNKIEGKILLIDDKYSDGWEDILKSFSDKYYANVKCEAVHGITKDLTIESIKKLLDSKHYNPENKNYNPDVILLDLRLIEADNNIDSLVNEIENKKSIDEISGLQILKHIKTISPATQVIMFTASNDSEILSSLYEENILGFIKKDSPFDKYKFSENKFDKLNELIQYGFTRKYLKDIFYTSSSILEILKSNPFLKYENIDLGKDDYYLKLLEKNTEYIFDILDGKLENKYNYAMVSIATSLETIVNIFLREVNNDEYLSFWDGKVTSLFKKASLENRLIEILENRFGYTEKLMLWELILNRNAYMHSNSKYQEVSSSQIVDWFQILQKIIQVIDQPPKYKPFNKNKKKKFCNITKKWLYE